MYRRRFIRPDAGVRLGTRAGVSRNARVQIARLDEREEDDDQSDEQDTGERDERSEP